MGKLVEALTVQQRRFVKNLVLLGMTQAKAYVEAGYAGAAPKNCAAALMSRPYMRAAVAELEAEVDAKATIKVAGLAAPPSRKEVVSVWADIMRDTGQRVEARLRASENIAKARGMFVERRVTEHRTSRVEPSELSDAELCALAMPAVRELRDRWVRGEGGCAAGDGTEGALELPEPTTGHENPQENAESPQE